MRLRSFEVTMTRRCGGRLDRRYRNGPCGPSCAACLDHSPTCLSGGHPRPGRWPRLVGWRTCWPHLVAVPTFRSGAGGWLQDGTDAGLPPAVWALSLQPKPHVRRRVGHVGWMEPAVGKSDCGWRYRLAGARHEPRRRVRGNRAGRTFRQDLGGVRGANPSVARQAPLIQSRNWSRYAVLHGTSPRSHGPEAKADNAQA
jgi:hypothetical protein